MLGPMLASIVANSPVDTTQPVNPPAIVATDPGVATQTATPPPPQGLAPSTFAILQKYTQPGSASDPQSFFDSLAVQNLGDDKDYPAAISNLQNAVKTASGPNDPKLVNAWNQAWPVFHDISQNQLAGLSPEDAKDLDEMRPDLQTLVADHKKYFPAGLIPNQTPSPIPVQAQTSPQGLLGSAPSQVPISVTPAKDPQGLLGSSGRADISNLNITPGGGSPLTNSPLLTQGMGSFSSQESPVSQQMPPPTQPLSIQDRFNAIPVPTVPDFTQHPLYPQYQAAQDQVKSDLQGVRDANTALATIPIPDAPGPKDFTTADALKAGIMAIPALFMRGEGAGSYLSKALQSYNQAHDTNLDTDDVREYQQKVNQAQANLQNAQSKASQSQSTLQDLGNQIQQGNSNQYSVAQQQYQNQVTGLQLAAQAEAQGAKTKAAIYSALANPKMTVQSLNGLMADAEANGVNIDQNDPFVKQVFSTAAGNELQAHEMAMKKIQNSGDAADARNLNNAQTQALNYLKDWEATHGGINASDIPTIQSHLSNLATTYGIDPAAMPPLSAYESIRGQLNDAQITNINASAAYKNMQTQYYPANMQRMADATYGGLTNARQKLEDSIAMGDQTAQGNAARALLTQNNSLFRLATAAQMNIQAQLPVLQAAAAKEGNEGPANQAYADALTKIGQLKTQAKQAQDGVTQAQSLLKTMGNVQPAQVSPVVPGTYAPGMHGIIGSGRDFGPGIGTLPPVGAYDAGPDVQSLILGQPQSNRPFTIENITPSAPRVGVSSPAMLHGITRKGTKHRRLSN